MPAPPASTDEAPASLDEPPVPSSEAKQAGESTNDSFSESAFGTNKQATVQHVALTHVKRGKRTIHLVEPETAPPQEERNPLGTSSPFKISAANDAAGEMRMWFDSTGRKHVRARLVSVRQKRVLLLKDTGSYTTVPLDRLSHDDIAFVRRQTSSLIVETF